MAASSIPKGDFLSCAAAASCNGSLCHPFRGPCKTTYNSWMLTLLECSCRLAAGLAQCCLQAPGSVLGESEDDLGKSRRIFGLHDLVEEEEVMCFWVTLGVMCLFSETARSPVPQARLIDQA